MNSVPLHSFPHLAASASDQSIDEVITRQKEDIKRLEQKLWNEPFLQKNLLAYQDAFKALEKLYALKRSDERYNFKIIIPVADRPQHLKQCLDSLLTLCRHYQYGSPDDSQFSKVSVLIADDSHDEKNIELHKNYCRELTAAGIQTDYFGLDEQLALVNHVTEKNRGLAEIIGKTGDLDNTADFSHKGASIMRNISYLKLKQCVADNNTLLYFIDSDQEFCINRRGSDNHYYAINYFYYLNEIFKTQDISILTGKVVGDPPVSPAVMAGNFQQDIESFLKTISLLPPDDNCRFHQDETARHDDAAYHDMASLFGFDNQDLTFDYHCTLKNRHSNADCFADFSGKLARFFYGEHPTRKTFFNYDTGFSDTTPARTVYTGNYVIKPEALNYFIPFASLKLRMAGPVLGRILKTRLQQRFVSANLPMLHNRTIEQTGRSEFRPGVENRNSRIDLGDEFIRQFYGDVMLFSMEQITDKGFPGKAVDEETIRHILDTTYKSIRQSYIEKHNTILQLKQRIDDRLNTQGNWWNHGADLDNFNRFLENIQLNFDDNTDAFQQIISTPQAQQQLNRINRAILHYRQDFTGWKQALNA